MVKEGKGRCSKEREPYLENIWVVTKGVENRKIYLSCTGGHSLQLRGLQASSVTQLGAPNLINICQESHQDTCYSPYPASQ